MLSGNIWKKILLFASPVLIGSLTTLYYFYVSSQKRRSRTLSGTEILTRKECPVLEVPSQSPLDAAMALKNRGNKNFKAGRFAKAVQCYTEALEQCPPESIEERATFYQNRAAAQENLQQYKAAIDDCTAALELSPRYMKALNRRAHLYEKVEDLELGLRDATACCMLERFQNSQNVMTIDRVLKQLGQNLAKEELANIQRSLPSAAFITNYLSAFAWNPFRLSEMLLPSTTTPHPEDPNGEVNGNSEVPADDNAVTAGPYELPPRLAAAYEALEKAMDLLATESYEKSAEWAVKSVKKFDSAPQVDRKDFERSRFGDREKPDAARARALLLDTTFKALSGFAEEAKTQLLVIGEAMFATPRVRVNALIKAACLSMTIGQDIPACLYTFQQAQTLCPDCPDIYLHRGQINLLSEKLVDALSDFNEAVKLQPNFSVAQAQRLFAMYRRDMVENNSEKAEKRVREFRILAEKYPTCLETHSLYAQVLTERGEFDVSDEEFGKVIDLSPSSGMAYAHRGLLQLRWKQDQVAAMDWFKKGVAVDPKCELALELLGQLSMERGNFEDALGYFKSAIQHAKTLADLTHLISLREGVKAQMYATSTYNISVAELFSSLQQDFQINMATAGQV